MAFDVLTKSSQVLELPAPIEIEALSLHQALKRRRTVREMSQRPLPPALLSNLLWSAWGVNRLRGPFGALGRTAASASNSQEIDLYVALPDGVYLYEPEGHRLERRSSDDLRALAMNGPQGLESAAPVQIIYVVDLDRLTHTAGFDEPGLHDPEVQKAYYCVDTGLIAGHVALFAAAHGLAAWFHNCQKDELAGRLKLKPSHKVLFAQTVGWPHEREPSSGALAPVIH